MKRELIPDVLSAYDRLAAGSDVIVIEGAGSPAEIDLPADPFVNMGLARLVDAPVLEVRTRGMFDSGEAVGELADRLLERMGLPPMRFCPLSHRDYLEEQFDLLAQTVREGLDLPAVYRAMEKYERGTSL